MKDDNSVSQSDLWRVVRAAKKERDRQNKAGIYKPADYYVWLNNRDPKQPTAEMREIIDALTKIIVECHDFRITSELPDRIEGQLAPGRHSSPFVNGGFRFYKESINPDDDRTIIFNILYDEGGGNGRWDNAGTFKIYTKLSYFSEDARVAFSLLGLIA